MKITVIVAFYKNLPFLHLLLEGLQRQTYKNFEVIVAEDDDAATTKEYIARRSGEVSFTLKHVCHPDQGFRKNKILNAAIRASEGEFFVLLDQDCIPHRQCLKEYARIAAVHEGTFFFGRRVMMSESLTKKLVATGRLQLLSLFSQVRHRSKRVEDGVYLPFILKKSNNNGLLGCNWGILKKHMLEVNGYDEDYITAGVGEDIDIEWRLMAHGLKKQTMRHRAIVYHLHHPSHYSFDAPESYAVLKKKKAEGRIYCVHGLDQHA